MSIFIILFAAVLAAVAQRLTIRGGIERLEVEQHLSSALVEPDEFFDIVITLTNRGRAFIPYLRIRERLPEEAGVRQEYDAKIVDNGQSRYVTGTTWLKPRQRLEKRIPVSIPSRGRYLLWDPTIYSGDFLGLSEQKYTYERMDEVVVYPREAPEQELGQVFGGFLGDVSVSRFLFEDPVLTLGYREYTGREPMKMISWTQSARSGALMVKKFDYTLEPSVTVVLNIETALEDGRQLGEKCLSLTRTVCRKLEDQGIKYAFSMNAVALGALSGAHGVGEGLGRRHYLGVLEHLGRAELSPRISCQQLLEQSFRSSSSQGMIFITPGGEPETEAGARRLAEAYGVRLLTITAKEAMEC